MFSRRPFCFAVVIIAGLAASGAAAQGDGTSTPTDEKSADQAAERLLRCLDDDNVDIQACLDASADLARAGQPVAAAALAEQACTHGAPQGCTRAGQLLLPDPSTRAAARALLDQACDQEQIVACLNLGDAERGGLFGEPNDGAALAAYQKGCALERVGTGANVPAPHGPACAALVDTLGEDPFVDAPPKTDRRKNPRPPTPPTNTLPPRPNHDQPQPRPRDDDGEPRKPDAPTKRPNRLESGEREELRDPLLTARARFALGAFILEGGGRLLLGANSNPWMLPSPASTPVPFLHGGAAIATFAPVGRIRFDLVDIVGASLEVGGDWTGFVGGDVGVPNGFYLSGVQGGYNIDAAVGLGRDIIDLPVEDNGSDRNLLSVRNRTRARVSPGTFLPAVDVGTRRAERENPAPQMLFPLAPGSAGDLLGVSENLFNLDARLDFLINLELGYAWTRQRVEVFNPIASPDGVPNALTLPLFFLPVDSLGPHAFDEHAGRIRGGLSMPKFDFFGPAHIFGEFSLARRAYQLRSLYPTTARAGIDAKAEIFEVKADAGAANSGVDQVFGSDSHFVGGLSVAVPIGAKWWVEGAIDRRMLPVSISDWGVTSSGGVTLQNRGRATAIAIFAKGGTLEFGANAPGFSVATDAYFVHGGARAELRFGPFRPSVDFDLQAYLPRTSAPGVYVGQARVGIGF